MSSFLAIVVCAVAALADGPVVRRDIVYDRNHPESCLGDLLLPERVTPNTPVVLTIHGGGWRSGDRYSWVGVADFFRCELGFASFNIEYRKAREAPWPACGDDCIQAAKFILGGGLAAYGVSPRRIWVCGGSAGGHLALWTGLSISSSNVAGVVSLSGIGDTTPDFAAHRGRYQGFLGSEVTPQLLRSASPLSLIRAGGPRILCTHATEDRVVPISSARNFAEAYRVAGNDIRFYEYPAEDPSEFSHFIWRKGSDPHRLNGHLESAIRAFVSGAGHRTAELKKLGKALGIETVVVSLDGKPGEIELK